MIVLIARIIYILIFVVLGFFILDTLTQINPIQGRDISFKCGEVNEIPPTECEALVELYEKTDGPNWSEDIARGWLVTNTPCSWYGVICEEKSVAELRLKEPTSRAFGITGGIPSGISKLLNIKVLYLNNHQINSIPTEIGSLNNLVEINLRKGDLENLPPDIGSLNNLTHLILSDNMLTTLPPEIGHLNNLTSFNVSENLLTHLPLEIGGLDNLVTLQLEFNKLSRLPIEINYLHNLKTLDLEFNHFVQFPKIDGLSNLTALYAGGNDLNSLSAEIGMHSNLTTLSLWGNNLSTLPSEIGNLSNLTTIDLSSNHLSNLPPDFTKLVGLTNLTIGGNHLTEVSAELRIFLDEKAPGWADRQTLLPPIQPTPTIVPTDSKGPNVQSTQHMLFLPLILGP